MEVVTGSGSKDDECVMVESDIGDLTSLALDLREGIDKGKVDKFGGTFCKRSSRLLLGLY